MGKMRVTTEILSVPFDVCTMDEAVAKVSFVRRIRRL